LFWNDIKHGAGRFFYHNGDTFDGNFEFDKQHGEGRLCEGGKWYNVLYHQGRLQSKVVAN